MLKSKFKYPGDAAVQRLLTKYGCPTPFHIVRMRFLGEIASFKLGSTPMETVESLWDHEIPDFQSEEEASNFFQTLISLWNRMARHQDGVLVKLTRPKKLKTWDDISETLVMRAEEVQDGFLGGFLAADDEMVPVPFKDTVAKLDDVAEGFGMAAERIRRSDFDDMTLDDYRKLIEEGTKGIEQLLTTIVGITKAMRGQEIRAMRNNGGAVH